MDERNHKSVIKSVILYAAAFICIQVMFSGIVWVYFGLAEFSFVELKPLKFLIFEISTSFTLAFLFLYLVMMKKRVIFVYLLISAMLLMICVPLIRESFAAISRTTKYNFLLLSLISISFVIEWVISFWVNWQTIHKKNILNVYPLDKENGMWNLTKPINKPVNPPEKTKKQIKNIAIFVIPIGSILGQMIYRTQSQDAGYLIVSTVFLVMVYLFIAVSAIPASNASLVMEIEKVLNIRIRAYWK